MYCQNCLLSPKKIVWVYTFFFFSIYVIIKFSVYAIGDICSVMICQVFSATAIAVLVLPYIVMSLRSFMH